MTRGKNQRSVTYRADAAAQARIAELEEENRQLWAVIRRAGDLNDREERVAALADRAAEAFTAARSAQTEADLVERLRRERDEARSREERVTRKPETAFGALIRLAPRGVPALSWAFSEMRLSEDEIDGKPDDGTRGVIITDVTPEGRRRIERMARATNTDPDDPDAFREAARVADRLGLLL